MSHEIDTSTGKPAMAYTGAEPWHGLGQDLPDNASLEVWTTAAGLDWRAVVSPLTATLVIGDEPEEGEEDTREQVEVPVPNSRALVRDDTQAVLSVVSKGYKPVQPSEVMGFFKDYVEGLDAGFKMETAGSLNGGKKIWALAKCVDASFIVGKNDKVDQYLLLATSFDRSLPTLAQLTSTRVVCSNTLRVAANDKQNQLRITHNRKFEADLAKEALGLKDSWDVFAEECMRFAEKEVSEDQSRRYIAEVLVNSNPHLKKNGVREGIDEVLENENKTFEEIMAIRSNAPGQDIAVGSVWGDLNAITYWADHEINAKNNDNRWSSACFGRGKRVKDFAYELAKELI